MRRYLSAVALLLFCAVAAPSSAFGAAAAHRRPSVRVSHHHTVHVKDHKVHVNRHHAVPAGQLEARDSVRQHRATERHVRAHRADRHVVVHHVTRHVRVRRSALRRRSTARSRYETARLERIRRERIDRERVERERARWDRDRRARAAEEDARLDRERQVQERQARERHAQMETTESSVAETVDSDSVTTNGITESNLSATGSSEAAEAASFETTSTVEDRPAVETQDSALAEYIPPIPMRDGRLYVPPPLYGSLASLLRQNRRDEAEGLARIQNVSELDAMRRDGQLVSLPVSEALTVNPQVPYDRRCARPWTVTFLANLAHAHFVRFHRPLQVTSAVRPVSYQRRLVRVNGNAAPAYGDTSSPHERGATIDIGKKGMTLAEVAWMRAYLLPLQEEGKIDVEEEFEQACFHITVYESYIPSRKRYGRHASTLLATGMP